MDVFHWASDLFSKNIDRHVATRVKSGNFRHQVNSDMHLQTVEIQISGFSPFA